MTSLMISMSVTENPSAVSMGEQGWTPTDGNRISTDVAGVASMTNINN